MLNWDDYNQDDSHNLAAQTPAPAVVAAAVATEQVAEVTEEPHTGRIHNERSLSSGNEGRRGRHRQYGRVGRYRGTRNRCGPRVS